MSDQSNALKEKITKLELKEKKMAEKLKLILNGPKESPPNGHKLEDLLENVSLKF